MGIEISDDISPPIARSLNAFAESLRGFQKFLRIYRMELQNTRVGIMLNADFQNQTGIHQLRQMDEEITDPRYIEDDWERRGRELVRRSILEMTGLRPAWGILTGVRPGKLYRTLQSKEFNPEEIVKRLVDIYWLDPSKAELLREVGEAQSPYTKYHPREIGVYLGIPFCPTRCRYCSFASHPLGTHGHLVKPFVEAVIKETLFMANQCQELGWRVKTVYVGGGTPTSIPAEDLRSILFALREFPMTEDVEFTIEAGRPETIDDLRLQACTDAGINRISVNPQTLHDSTLQRIGRNHSVDDIFRAVDRVRQFNIPTLNMDLIAGLPGEDLEMIDQSLAGVLRCHPENITIHTLAPKRAAEWREKHLSESISDEELAYGLDNIRSRVHKEGFHPYYLYRQRRILADQENIGYSLPGQESLYNIWMMEETRTIMGLGGGAITKWVHPVTGVVERWSNPKCPATFTQQIAAAMQEKAKWLKGHLN